MLFPDDLSQAAADLLKLAETQGVKIATAESCTGGLIAACLTEIPGSSAVVERGFVTYSNEAKTELLGVPETVLAVHGAVSAQTAKEMVNGALSNSRADLAVSVTGIAGPGGGTRDKPVGLVWFGLARRGDAPTTHEMRFGDLGRARVRLDSVRTALTLLRGALEGGDQAGGVG